MWQEIRTRATLEPTTLEGEQHPDGTHITSVEVPGMLCFANGNEWRRGGSKLIVACVDLARPAQQYIQIGDERIDVWEGRLRDLGVMVNACFPDFDSEFAYTTAWHGLRVDKTTTKGQAHSITGSKADTELHEGRFMWSLIRPR